MITKRIIPCLDVRNGRVVKGVNFLGLADVSSPVKLAKFYSEGGADELVFYDITASAEGRRLFTDILTQVAGTVFIPLTVGGGINTLDDFARVLLAADEVILADIYAAREVNKLGVSANDIALKMEEYGKHVHYLPSFDEIETFILENCVPGDLLITMGAGDIVKVGEKLLGK